MKKLFTTFLALVACVSLTFATTPQGNCGTKDTDGNYTSTVTWSYDETTKVLTLTGSGDGVMADFAGGNNDANRAPWYKWDGDTKVRNSIQSIVFNGTITHIGNLAFNACKGLLSVTIPASVTSMGSQAFSQCEKLESVTLLANTEIGSNAFAGCKKLTSVTMPNVTSIKNGAFNGCESLTSFEIPSGVTSIKNNLFNGCTKLEVITLPSCINIEAQAFFDCSRLKRIIYKGSAKPTTYNDDPDAKKNTFNGLPTGVSLFVPNASASTFDVAPWNELFSIYAHAAEYDFVDGSATENDYSDIMAGLIDGSLIDITFTGRSFLRNGDYNTLCLPFNLSAEQLADETNPLYNFSIYEIKGMYPEGQFLKFKVDQVSSVVAGKPYIMKYNGEEENLSNPVFNYVTVTASEGQETIDQEETHLVKMVGLLEPTNIDANENTLFLLAGNQLAWAADNSSSRMKGFRAYFKILVEDHSPYYIQRFRSLAPRIVEQEEVATDIEVAEINELQAAKVIENGTIYIIKNGVKYNVQGQVISK